MVGLKEDRKVFLVITLLIGVIILGTIGYMFLLRVSLIDALYMTVITISTVGYTEVGEMTPMAQLFSIIIIFLGLGTVGYGVTSAFGIFFEGSFREKWRKNKMKNRIDELKDHYILCGAGETGQSVIQYFLKSKVPFVVIEEREDRFEELEKRGIPAIQGDATQEDILRQAHIEQAKGFISSLPDDASNVFTVLTARQMNEKLYIVSRAIEGSTREKLKKAGANNTISPNEIGGTRMAAVMLRPTVISFLDIITRAGDVILDLEDVVIGKNSELAEKNLKEAKIPERTGLVVLAMRKKGQKNLLLNPSFEQKLEIGDAMVVLGKEEQVNYLRKLADDCGERDPIEEMEKNSHLER